MTGGIEIDYDVIDDDMRRLKPERVILQLPSGMRRMALDVSERISRRYGCDVVLSGDACFGACDIPSIPHGIADAIIQVGHSEMPSVRSELPAVFLPARITLHLDTYLDSIAQSMVSPIGIIATSQHLHQIGKLREALSRRGIETLVGDGSTRTSCPGHVLGCDYSSAKSIASSVSSFLLLGGGRFHAIGARLATGKRVFILDPEMKTVYELEVDDESLLRRRHAVIEKLADSKTIGVIVSTKIGQMRMKLAEELLAEIRSAGRTGQLLLVDELLPERLREFGFDSYVSTACPRLALDDSDRFYDILGTPIELLISLDKIDWSDYRFDDWSFGWKE
ncbi:MAG TPA: diphthamide biosynthesis enzyme Dph2 [Euryarchaeota archaeon]|nr:diphthamide biosynthesis enzyme Dph2 [Euryarchaeota archaeon]